MASGVPSKLYIKAKRIDSHIESVTSSIQKLIFVDRQKKEENIKRKRIIFSLVVLLLLSILGSLISNKGKAESVMFYPESCLGGWENVNKAINKPETEEGVDFSDLTSAILPKNSIADIYCGDFKGEIPEDSIPKAVVLRIAWSQDGKKIGTNLIESSNFASSTQEILDTSASSTPIIISTTTENEISTTTVSSEQTTEKTQDVKEEIKVDPIVEPVVESTEQPAIEPIMSPTVESTNPPIEESPQSSKVFDNIFSLLRNLFEKAYAEEVNVVDNTQNEIDNKQNITEAKEVIELKIDDKKEISESSVVEEIIPVSSEKSSSTEEINLSISTTTDFISTSTDILATTTSTSTEEASSSTSIMDLIMNSSKIFEIKYTFDGKEWLSLGFVSQNELRNSQFEIPINSSSTWGDLSKLQIQIKRLVTTDDVNDIYLDGMMLEVGYLKNIENKVDNSSDPKKFDISILEISNIRTSLANNEGGDYLLIGTSSGGQLIIYDNQKGSVVYSSGVGSDPVLVSAYNFSVGEYTAIITNKENGCDDVVLEVCKSDENTVGYSLFKIMPTKDTPIIYINESNELEQ